MFHGSEVSAGDEEVLVLHDEEWYLRKDKNVGDHVPTAYVTDGKRPKRCKRNLVFLYGLKSYYRYS